MKKILNFRPLFYCFIAFFTAIIFARYLFTTNWIYIGIFIALLFGSLIFFILRKKIKIFILILICFTVGLFGYCIDAMTYEVDGFAGTPTVVGRVANERQLYGNQKIVLDSVEVNGEKIDYNILLTIYGAPYLIPGDVIEFSGSVKIIDNFYNENIRTDYYKQNIRYYSSASGNNITIIGSNKSLSDTIQYETKVKLYKNMTEDKAAIAYAVLFGDQDEIDNSTVQDYRASGIAHILSISGLHVAIIVGFLYWLLKKFRSKHWLTFIIITSILAFYCYLCGFSSPVVRSAIMSVCLLGSALFGKRYDALSAIGLAGILILLIAPFSAFDIGFQLSFGCAIGISIFYRPLYSVLRKIKFPKFIAGPLAVSIIAQFFIFPIMLNAFGGSSIFSVLLNVLVVPVFSIAYVIIFIATPLLFLSNFFGNFLWFSSLLLEGINICANFVSSLTWSIIPRFELSFAVMLGFYSIVFICSNLVFLKPKAKISASLIITAITLTLVGITQIV